jgi:glycosyltransferase involved in cell wall biosynthesis
VKIALIIKHPLRGGASIACNRLMVALNNNEVEATMVVQESSQVQEHIAVTSHGRAKKLLNFCRFVWERLCFLPYESSKEVRFAFSLANTGEDISKLKEVREADVLHLHWFNQGYLSLRDLKKLFKLGKPVVWTMHDMWAFTGGCHYSGQCLNYTRQCGDCFYLKKPKLFDLSHRIYAEKAKLYKDFPLVLVGCSNWMAGKALSSSLLNKARIESIPNPIDIEIFSARDKVLARKALNLPVDKKIILFGAANPLDKRKGIDYLLQSLEVLISRDQHLASSLHCAVFGKLKKPIVVPLGVSFFNYINSTEQLINLYSAADVFVLPSLDDNLPNTVMEALACSIPVVAFNTGGLPEMVDHLKNGFLAAAEDVNELAEGIKYILFDSDYPALKVNARMKVLENFHPDRIAKQYIDLYNSILKK